MKTHCDRCGKDCRMGKFKIVPTWELVELRTIYQTNFVAHVCRGCGNIADSYVNYWGEKKPEDIIALNQFLNTGKVSMSKHLDLYSMLNNAGYRADANDFGSFCQ